MEIKYPPFEIEVDAEMELFKEIQKIIDNEVIKIAMKVASDGN